MNDNYTVKDLVLVGGGHSHAILLKLWAMNPIEGVRITLITDTTHTPYSGMLPGHVAGFYNFDETHIDLRRLARFANARLYLDRAIGLDLVNNRVICKNHPPVAFDYLSLDIGSTPATDTVPGAIDYTIPAKPVPQLLQAWSQIIQQASEKPDYPLSISIVGGGAGGVELALNMQSRLQSILNNSNLLTLHLVHRGTKLLSNHNAWVSQHLESLLRERSIHLYLQQIVTEVLPNQIICASGLRIKSDYIIWVTRASAPDWIENSGLTTDTNGFISVQNTLQSVSHPHIFAAGDIATMQNHPRPKAGVFAVRQGKPLFENLRRIMTGKPLKSYIPQRYYLSLIGTGDKRAIASWGVFGWESGLLWRWKDRIDRQFMRRLNELPQMSEGKKGRGGEGETISMRCAGCGAKVSSTILERVLQRLEITTSPEIIIGLSAPDDAAVVKGSEGQLSVHTIDFFPSLINDPYIFGQIATHHCLSDLFAMGATPQTVLAVVTVPYASEAIIEETLDQLLSGVTKALKDCQTHLIGGHTTEGTQLAFGLACNGIIAPKRLLTKGGMQANQAIILTKAIGTGTLFAADMRHQAKGRWIDNAVTSMLLSNQTAAKILGQYGATACTDITGFGLLGHLVEMVKASGMSVEIRLDSLPILEGALETIQQGITSSLHSQNLRAANYIKTVSPVINSPTYELLFDPQTSGGLLATIPLENVNDCLQDLKNSGYYDSCSIGRVLLPALENDNFNIWLL